uniref:Uncharacterized protein n=1 Tax=Caulerpa cliftonii TaxID=1004391 RepID=A0A1C9JBR2_9CHLO|nr:hypothetical protein [Caulerpa cliftonii]AOP19288.1 hypothetical protein [Caulerpa cliftonii]
MNLFTAIYCLNRHPFSRSYGAILPSSLERVISHPLVYSTYLPVSVYGTGHLNSKMFQTFLGNRTKFKLGMRQAPAITYHVFILKQKTVQVQIFVFEQYVNHFRSEPFGELEFVFFVLCHKIQMSTGILTCYPSMTLFSLILGPD